MRRKGAQDAKKGKILTKVQREITAACKTGMPDPAVNPRLRAAVLWAREENMPRDRIEAAIKRASSSASTLTPLVTVVMSLDAPSPHLPRGIPYGID